VVVVGELEQVLHLVSDALGAFESASAMAAVIVHESTHLAGGSEPAARDAELQFFGALVTTGLVSREDGRRYLALLRQRPRQKDD
jgi:hypothetical protein